MVTGLDVHSQNRLLAALPADLAELSELEDVELRRGDVLVESGPAYGAVYFPHAGLISLVVTMPDGAVAEAGLVGREGLAGHPYLADFDAAPARAIVQVPGRAAKLSSELFHAAVGSSPAVREVLGNYARAFLAQTLQTVACNALHELDERLAKWLLQSTDRVDGEMPLTHEFLSEMLGASRPAVSLAARTMQKAGLIRYSRGRIEIIDEEGLEEIACPCYRSIRSAYEQLLPLTYA